MSSQVGNQTTPGPGFFGEGLNTGDQVATAYVMPSPGGFLQTLHAFAATFTGTLTPQLCVWDASGNLLAHVAAGASVGTSGAWVSGTLPGNGQYIAPGATFYLGFATSAADGFNAYYTGSGSGIWNEQASPPGSMAGNTGWSSGQLGAYADYSPSGLKINTGTPSAPVWTDGPVHVNTGTPASPVWTPTEVFVNTGTPASPVWTPTS